jgi:hypothetical protein
VSGSRESSRQPRRARRALVSALVAMSTFSIALPARPAARIEGVDFEDRVTVSGVEFKLNAVGLLRYMVFIKAYVAGLYLGPGADPTDILADTPKRLEISYFWAISAEDFVSSTREAIARNVGETTFRKIGPHVEKFLALYRDVEPGDRYALTYVPGVGTELALNGAPLGSVEGSDFAAAVFAVWFGRDEIDGALKKSLLEKP